MRQLCLHMPHTVHAWLCLIVLLCSFCRQNAHIHTQDDIYQAYEDQLPYSEFSVRLPSSSIPDIIALLSEISDEEYLKLRAGMLKFWRAFVWDTAIGGQAVSPS